MGSPPGFASGRTTDFGGLASAPFHRSGHHVGHLIDVVGADQRARALAPAPVEDPAGDIADFENAEGPDPAAAIGKGGIGVG